jgi:NADP-dependent 3-hydroxy acid dehydrogenase YdfG
MVVDMNSKGREGTAVVTGASSGIGAATARALAEAGFDVVLGARRLDRLEAVAAELPGARALPLDVTDASSVESFCGQVPSCRVLVNNAGGAFGLEPIAEADEEKWREMWESNVLGTLRMTRGLLGKLIAWGTASSSTCAPSPPLSPTPAAPATTPPRRASGP